jgi:hypothetical protein
MRSVSAVGHASSLAVSRFEIEASYRHRAGCRGITPLNRVVATPLPRVHDRRELIVATDRRIGTPGSALPTKDTAT